MKKAVFLTFLLATTFLLLGLPSVSAPGIGPLPTDIWTTSNETFVIPFKMTFNESGDPPEMYYGYWSVVFFWDCNQTDPNGKYWNFTYEGFKCWFTDGTNFSVPINVTITKGLAPPDYIPGNYRYTITIYEYYGEPYNGDFWVNVTMRAAGVADGSYIPHIGSYTYTKEGYIYIPQIITISKVRCNEDSWRETPSDVDCAIYVTPKILSCDETGSRKDIFNVTLGEMVYVKGYGFGGDDTINLYVLQNTTWMQNQTWTNVDDVRGAFNLSIQIDSGGNLGVTALGLLPIGEYDIVADAYPFRKYDTATDAVDDLSSAPGITVVPEFHFGIATIVTILAVTSVITYIKKRKNPSFI